MQQTKKVNYFHLSLKNGQTEKISFSNSFQLTGKGGGSFVYIAQVFDTDDLDSTFHRLKLYGQFEKCKYEIWVMACNTDESGVMESSEVSMADKLAYMQKFSYQRSVNTDDILLHSLSGRYLWVAIRVMAAAMESSFVIDGFSVEFPKSSFIDYLPEIYREDSNSFFERYMAVLQSLYEDLEERIEEVPKQLDYESCDKKNLPLFAQWTGLDENGKKFTPEQLRYLIAHLQTIQSGKGTTDVLQKIISLVYGKQAKVIENFKWNEWMKNSEYLEHYKKLYGKDESVFTLMLDCVYDEPENLPDKSELMKLISEYTPLGVRCHLVYLRENYNMDTHCYLDVNSVLSTPKIADASGFELGSNHILG